MVDRDNASSDVWADTAYRSQANEDFLTGIGKTSRIHRRKTKGKPMAVRKSKIQAVIEHVFAEQKHRVGLIIRTVGIARAKAEIGLANIAFNMCRLVWLEARTVPG